MSILTVGAGRQFSSIASAVGAAADGDVVRVDAGTYTNDFFEVSRRITIEGAGGVARLVATREPWNGKGIITTNTDVTLRDLDISGAFVSDRNGAAIRYQGGNLTVERVRAHGNENGLLGGSDAAGTITIRDSEFDHNGEGGEGQTHNIYVGRISRFTLTNSYVHDANVGHQVKSRAATNVITGNRILDNTSTSSYSIDLPNGGAATISGNVIQQGGRGQNPNVLAYGAEGGLHGSKAVSLADNVFVNDRGGFVNLLLNRGEAAVSASNNVVFGIGSGNLGVSASGFSFVSNRPVVNTTPGGTGAANTPTQASLLGNGPDTLVVNVSGDSYNGDARVTITMNGQTLAEGRSVTATRGSGASQDFTFKGPFGAGPHRVEVSFLNDEYGGSASTDRNLYVNRITFNGAEVANSRAFLGSTGTAEFKVSGPAAPVPAPVPAGMRALSIVLNEDAYKGDAQARISVDGAVVFTGDVKASRTAGMGQEVALGNHGPGPHTVSVVFLNDLYDGSASTDRNLYVVALKVDGAVQAGSSAALLSTNSVVNMVVPAATGTVATPDSHRVTLRLSEDEYKGHARFIAKVDGVAISDAMEVTTRHGQGEQTFNLTASFSGTGPRTVSVEFINDAYDGSPETDRNLFVHGIAVDGVEILGREVGLYSAGTTSAVLPGTGGGGATVLPGAPATTVDTLLRAT